MGDSIRKTGKNCLIMALILGTVTVFCFFLSTFSNQSSHVPLLYVLAVFFVSRLTDGYCYGILASMIAVVGVNYVFTFPYFEVNFTLTGYPVTFLVMLAVSISVSAMMTRIKKQEQIRLEIETEKMRGNLLRAVSHDIRTPLTSIIGAASGIIDNYDVLSKEKKLTLLSDIKEEAQWLIRIVENLLSITRMNGDGASLDTQEELVEEIISEAVEKFRKRYSDVEINVKLPDEVLMPPMDGILIEQVLSNLMENSVQHGKTTTKITICVWRDGQSAVIDVRDNGQGIRPSALTKIFDGSLKSEDNSSSDSKRNMGIGLSVCRSIVKAHKGNMKAENIEGGGASISFSLPLEE